MCGSRYLKAVKEQGCMCRQDSYSPGTAGPEDEATMILLTYQKITHARRKHIPELKSSATPMEETQI
jgi:hypothetical protein